MKINHKQHDIQYFPKSVIDLKESVLWQLHINMTERIQLCECLENYSTILNEKEIMNNQGKDLFVTFLHLRECAHVSFISGVWTILLYTVCRLNKWEWLNILKLHKVMKFLINEKSQTFFWKLSYDQETL